MEARPPEMMEKIVRLLVPPVSREPVIGDLRERYVSPRRYLLDVIRTLPFVIGSQLRRTQEPAVVAFVAVLFYYGPFMGNAQEHWLIGTVATLVALTALMLRDAYRMPKPMSGGEAVVDSLVVFGAVLLSQGVFAVVSPGLLLDLQTFTVGIPFGCIVLSLLRLQNPGGPRVPAAALRSMSLQELLAEVRTSEALVRRNVRSALRWCFFVVVLFAFLFFSSPDPIRKLGCGMLVAGALFIAWYLHRNARVQPMPDGLGFAESVARYRAQIERRLRLSRTYGWWFVLPMAVGPIVVALGIATREQDSLWKFADKECAAVMLIAAVYIQLRRVSARELQKRLDQLAVMKEKT